MKQHPRIFFITGFMGVGKTYWGKRLSEKFHFDHFDTDTQVESLMDSSIQEVIEEKGLRYFRQKETETLRRIISHIHRDTIVSLGGGTLLDHDNLELVKNNGLLIWLKSKPKLLTSAEIEKRPLFDKENIGELYLERKEAYLKADKIINLDRYENEAEIESVMSEYVKA